MNKPVVTVLLPVHNALHYFSESLESILTQSFSDFELLVLDDASNDGSEKIARQAEAADSRVQVLRSNSKLGLSAQLNRGIAAANGQFVARMDADDISLPHRFAKQVNVMSRRPEIGICGCVVTEFSDDATGPRWVLPECHDDIASLQFIRCGFNHPSVMIRTDILKQYDLQYRKDYIVAQDYELWSRLLKHSRGYNIQDSLVKYRRFPAQLSQAKSDRKERELGMIRLRMRELIGLKADQRDHERHERFANDHWPDDIEWFNEITDWLNLVYKSNLRTHAMPVNAFGRLLAQRLYLQCHMATKRGFDGWAVFQRSVFKHHAKVGVLQRLKTVAKSMVR